MAKASPVIAAIPNYNIADNLRILRPQVLAQGYDAVFALDDASTDHSVDVLNEFRDEVKLVGSLENRGVGANRNQIIDHVGDGQLSISLMPIWRWRRPKALLSQEKLSDAMPIGEWVRTRSWPLTRWCSMSARTGVSWGCIPALQF
jgi:Glycosyl transferase family 2